jgi:hypothetical protein
MSIYFHYNWPLTYITEADILDIQEIYKKTKINLKFFEQINARTCTNDNESKFGKYLVFSSHLLTSCPILPWSYTAIFQSPYTTALFLCFSL